MHAPRHVHRAGRHQPPAHRAHRPPPRHPAPPRRRSTTAVPAPPSATARRPAAERLNPQAGRQSIDTRRTSVRHPKTPAHTQVLALSRQTSCGSRDGRAAPDSPTSEGNCSHPIRRQRIPSLACRLRSPSGASAAAPGAPRAAAHHRRDAVRRRRRDRARAARPLPAQLPPVRLGRRGVRGVAEDVFEAGHPGAQTGQRGLEHMFERVGMTPDGRASDAARRSLACCPAIQRAASFAGRAEPQNGSLVSCSPQSAPAGAR